MSITLEPTGFTVVPEGEYKANLVDITQDTAQHGDVLKWKFEISDGDCKGTNITGLTSKAWSSQSKSREWATALANRQWAGDENLNTAELIDLPCRLKVDELEKSVKGEMMNVNRIEQVLLPVKSQTKSAPVVDVDQSTLEFVTS